MPNLKNWVYNGKRIKIIDTNLLLPDSDESTDLFVDDKFNLAIWDKSLGIHIGSAKQNSDGTYTGYFVYGMQAVDISGNTLRELAHDAYTNHLWALDN